MIKINGQELQGANFEQPCVLIGEPQTYKTTILLHYAYLKSKQLKENQYGLIVCSQIKLDKEDKLLFGRSDYRKNLVAKCTERIKMKYIETYSELCKLLSAFSLMKFPPQFLFVDDVNHYAGSDPKKLSYLLFLLRWVSSQIHLQDPNSKNFHILMTWQMDTQEYQKDDNQKDELDNRDINLDIAKKPCLVFKSYTQNVFQVKIYENDLSTIQLYKIHQSLETLQMSKSIFRSNEFKEILEHIISLGEE